MGGSVRRGYGRAQYAPPSPPAREYNVGADVAAAQAVFASGVPIVLFPLDATLVQLDDVRRRELFAHGSPQTDALTLLYQQWSSADAPWASAIPTLLDVVPIATMIDASLCPTHPLRIVVGDDGFTIEAPGKPNAQVCLASEHQRVMDLMMRRLLLR
jgi:inosine-uridine nucleoside N-ribohydrolase